MDEAMSHSHPPEPPQVSHELRDAHVGTIALLGVALLVLIGGILLATGGMFDYFVAHPMPTDVPSSALAAARQVPPEPRLQTHPARDLQEMRAHEEAVLNSYGWVDRPAGIVRLPIDRAIDLLATRGLPARAEP